MIRAQILFGETLAMLEKVVGTSHPNYLIVRGNTVAQLPSAEERVAIYEQLIPQAETVFGLRSVIVAGLYDCRGLALADLGRRAAALGSCARAYELAVEAGGEAVLQAARAARHLGSIHLTRGDYPVALDAFESAFGSMKTDRRRAEILSLQALALFRLARNAEAVERSEAGLALARESVGDSPEDLVLASNLGPVEVPQ